MSKFCINDLINEYRFYTLTTERKVPHRRVGAEIICMVEIYGIGDMAAITNSIDLLKLSLVIDL